VPKENAQLLRAVNSALMALESNGTLGGLRGRYFAGRNFTYTTPDDIDWRPGYLSVAVPPDSPPYSFKDNEGNFMGFDIDVARAVCDFLGVELRLLEFDVEELVTAVWFGRADLALGWLPIEGEDLINTSDPYAYAVHMVLVRR
jgi:polar amino acid transport system substrate-binding protein